MHRAPWVLTQEAFDLFREAVRLIEHDEMLAVVDRHELDPRQCLVRLAIKFSAIALSSDAGTA